MFKIVALSVIINLIFIKLFVMFVSEPIKEASRNIAIIMCKSMNQECK